jgi:Abnormal spindle-like microcephaly-assoc'd, ASPM-SPD-2-Hydin
MSLNGTTWSPIGPSPIDQGAINANGQVTAIAVNPNNPNIIYIGTAWGGVWLTKDGGTTWTPIFDRAPALGVGEPGALAIDPIDTNIVYLGTSNRDGSQFSGESTQPPAGLFKSTDGGSSWVRLGSGYPSSTPGNANIFFNQVINVVIVDPANHQIVYLASNSGLFVSTDGGFNWTKGVAPPGGDVRSLQLDPTSPTAARILYAGSTSSGVLQSTDGGLNWTRILSTTTPAVAGKLAGGGFSKVVVALAPSTSVPNPAGIQVLYATMVGTSGAPDPVGVFLSTDQGNTWTAQTAAGLPGTTYGGYSFHMAVDPASPGDGVGDIIYYGTLSQGRSTDAGSSFVGLSGLHADTHSWGFAPQAGPLSVVFCGNDGGIFKCTGGTNFTSLNGGGFQTALFYNLDVKRDATASVTLGALQDNGIVTTAGEVAPTWKAGAGGDGFDVAHDWQLATQAYGRSNSTILRSTDDGDSYGGIDPPWLPSENKTYLAAVATDPSKSGGVYASSNQNLWQSTDGGSTWPNKVAIPGTATDVDVAPTNSNNVVVAVGGQVLVSTNALVPGGLTLTDITRDLPGRFVGRVAFDPNDPAIIYAVVGGLSGFPGGHVFRTSLLAATWTDISPALDLPFNAIALDGSENPTALYTGTDFGVLRSVDGGANWSVLDDIHFPGAPVFDLAFHQGELRAATFGRGVFSFVKPTGPSIAVSLEDNLAFGTVCEGPRYLTLEIYNVGVKDLVITSVQRLMGSSGFTVLSSPATPLILAAGEDIEFTVAYLPTGTATLETATIRIITNDPVAPVVDLSATAVHGAAKLATAFADSGNFGNVCLGSLRDEQLAINNTGSCRLLIGNIVSSSADFVSPGVASYPLVINPGESLDVVLRFAPSSLGAHAATITVFSNDPSGSHTLAVSGFAPSPRLSVALADSGSFGEVCVGSFRDQSLVLNNSGKCLLSVTNISSSSPEFLPPQVIVYPLTIAAGDSLEIPIRFQPTSIGAKAATITIVSDDPSGPRMIAASGDAPAGKLAVTGSNVFGGVSAHCCADRTISICNVGDCKLHVSSVAFKRKSSHWKLINNPFPATLRPGSCLGLTIRYKATEKCPRCCELLITSDDPAVPVKTLELLAYTIWNECGCEKCGDDCGKGGYEKHHCDRCSRGYRCCDDDDLEDTF